MLIPEAISAFAVPLPSPFLLSSSHANAVCSSYQFFPSIAPLAAALHYLGIVLVPWEESAAGISNQPSRGCSCPSSAAGGQKLSSDDPGWGRLLNSAGSSGVELCILL